MALVAHAETQVHGLIRDFLSQSRKNNVIRTKATIMRRGNDIFYVGIDLSSGIVKALFNLLFVIYVKISVCKMM